MKILSLEALPSQFHEGHRGSNVRSLRHTIVEGRQHRTKPSSAHRRRSTTYVHM